MNEPAEIWREFCKNLEQAGDAVLTADLACDKTERAEGLRYLSRLLRVGLEMHLENADPAFPSFYQASHSTAKIGSDNPDNTYMNATISGAYKYRIWGQRGTVPILSFGTKANRYAIDGSMASTGELDIRDVQPDSNGGFEIFASQKPTDKNWLPLEPDSSMLIVRQTFFDRSCETPAEVHIETINGPDRVSPLDFNTLSTGLDNAAEFVAGTSGIFRQWAETFRAENCNALNTVDQTMFIKAGGDPMIHYLHGWWSLAENEALEITAAIPDCEGWNFQLNNVWMESLDYRHSQIHINNQGAKLNDDGTVTIIVSADRQERNWIDTCGHRQGTMLWRWTGAASHPIPKVRTITTE